MKYNKKNKNLIKAILEFNPNLTSGQFAAILREMR